MADNRAPMITNTTLISCQYTNSINSKGYWYGDNPFDYNAPVLIAEIAFIFIFTRSIHILLQPLKQTTITTHIFAGILMGPSVLGRIKIYNLKLFPLRVRYVLRTFAHFGLMIHLFLLGVQTDLGLLKHLGKRAITIGITGTVISFGVGMLTFYIVHGLQPFDEDMAKGIPFMVSSASVSSFVVTTDLLNDLNMLNSDLGRLASLTSLVSNAVGVLSGLILSGYSETLNKSVTGPLKFFLAFLSYYGIMFFIVRPYIIWIINQTPAGKPMKESHFITIMCTVMGFGLVGVFIGQHPSYGSFMFGLLLPDGPPLGTMLVQKLELLASGVFLPTLCAMAGFRMNLDSLAENATDKMQVVMIMSYLGKFAGTILPSICFDISLFKAVTLALIMSCRGIMEMVSICIWRDAKIISSQQISLLITNMLVITMISTPLVVYLYDPSRRYMGYTRRTILKSKQNHLRILVCINKEENVNPMINLLEISNPTRSSPITSFVMQLWELKGSVSAFLKPSHKASHSSMDSSAHIINAFNQFQRRYNGNVVVQHFTTIAPYASMHDDICTLALDKRTNILIVPFHKTWDVSGLIDSFDPSIRSLNRNVLDKAPCSVGILVDRGLMEGNIPLFVTQSMYHIVVLFIGGCDDREAIAYSRRMAEHPHVSLTVVWLTSLYSNQSDKKSMDLDNEVMNELRESTAGKSITIKKEVVKDGMGTVTVIQMLKDVFDLFIVGKYHEPNSAIMSGLSEWNENPELGIIGDMLINSEDKFSILVVQQQPEETG